MHALVVGLAQRALFAAGNYTVEVQPLDGALLYTFFFKFSVSARHHAFCKHTGVY